MTTSKHINFAEVAALAAQAPARVKGVFTAEITYTQTEDSPVEIMKGIEIKATTLKAAIKEAGQMVKRFRNTFNPEYMMLFFYVNGLFVGTMSYYCEIGNIRCDFSGLAVSNAAKEETPAEVEETATEKPAEPTRAADLLSIYIDNDGFIYESYTQKAIESIVNDGLSPDSTEIQGFIKNALRRASWQVEKYDGIKPTPADIEKAKNNLTDYILECAQYEGLKTVTMFRLTSGSGCYSDFLYYWDAEKELQNLIDNGKTGTIKKINCTVSA